MPVVSQRSSLFNNSIVVSGQNSADPSEVPKIYIWYESRVWVWQNGSIGCGKSHWPFWIHPGLCTRTVIMNGTQSESVILRIMLRTWLLLPTWAQSPAVFEHRGSPKCPVRWISVYSHINVIIPTYSLTWVYMTKPKLLGQALHAH